MFTDVTKLVVSVDGVITNIVTGGHTIGFAITIANVSAYDIWIRYVLDISGAVVYTSSVTSYTPGQSKILGGNFTYVFSKDVVLRAVTYYRYLGVEYGPEDSFSVNLDYQKLTSKFSNMVITSFAKK